MITLVFSTYIIVILSWHTWVQESYLIHEKWRAVDYHDTYHTKVVEKNKLYLWMHNRLHEN